jgi:PAS domain S-box-containing protein
MAETELNTTRMILHAAARVLGCGSVQLARVDEEAKTLVFATSITNREGAKVAEVESVLGFRLEGASLPLDFENSLFVRAVTESRLFITHDVSDLTGGVVPQAAVAQIREAIGPRTFAVVPVASQSGAHGVLLFEKPLIEPFTPEERDLLVAYADRVGADLESYALSDDVTRLSTLDREGSHAPSVYQVDDDLRVTAPAPTGRALADVLGVPDELLRASFANATVPAALVVRGAAGRMLRLTLLRGVGGGVVAAEDLEAEDKLRREAARAKDHLAKVMRSVADAIFTLDEAGIVSSGNQAVERVLGYRPEEVRGMDPFKLVADNASAERAREIYLEVRSGGFGEGELRLLRKDMSTLVAEVTVHLLADDEERPAGMVWRVHDLTERRRRDAERTRLRAQLLQSERLSALGEMAARIAHEVRNPLVSIGAAAQVVAEELPDDSAVQNEVQAIVREVKRLDGIVTDFLQFARPRQHNRRNVDVQQVIVETLELARAKSGPNVLTYAPAGVLEARCNPDALKQVLLNVMLNAVEACPQGPIECEARRVRDQLVISVADRGAGILPAARGRVFDPFFSTKTRGTGLGLAVSKQIMDEHRGRIRLLARRGGGTRVVIELPVG